MASHISILRRTEFVLWQPRIIVPVPKLVIGRLRPGNQPEFVDGQEFDLQQHATIHGLWTIEASRCGLSDGEVYHYWFEVTDSSPTRNQSRILVTDPMALTVDWRLRSPSLPFPYGDDDRDPTAVIKYLGGELVSCDAAGETFSPVGRMASHLAAPNSKLVIYELPVTWSRINVHGDAEVGVGTFRDVIALVDRNASGANFDGVSALATGRSHLEELGVNALELLPIADSWVGREWGYATSNYFAPDHDLGYPEGNASPTSNTDLCELVRLCHERGIRFFKDIVMAFGTRAPLENLNFPSFHIDKNAEPHSPDAHQSGGQGLRMDFGGKLWHYGRAETSYDPVSGSVGSFVPARQFMKACIQRWMEDFGLNGIRIDSVNNVANWDFIQEFKDLARNLWRDAGGSEDRFLVIGEELSVPKDLLSQNRLDALWNEDFVHMLRYAIEGKNWIGCEPSFEWTVRKMIDCRLMGFADGSQAINYVGSHDVENYRGRRLHNQLQLDGISQTEERIKLAFACLLTAVGTPMILAGDEFADEHDLVVAHPEKQRDAVNFERMEDPWRRRIFDYVARLVRLRTTYEALSLNDTDFIHVDFNENKRVLCWRRGRVGSDSQVVVVANFSDYATPSAGAPHAEYRVPGWPATPAGKKWREVTQERDVPPEWLAREPIYPWEAKVYVLEDS